MAIVTNFTSEITDRRYFSSLADKFENLIGDDAKFNSDKILNIFEGEDNDFSKAVCLNAAAGLMISEKHKDFKIAYNYARGFIKSGAAFKYVKSLQNV